MQVSAYMHIQTYICADTLYTYMHAYVNAYIHIICKCVYMYNIYIYICIPRSCVCVYSIGLVDVAADQRSRVLGEVLRRRENMVGIRSINCKTPGAPTG